MAEAYKAQAIAKTNENISEALRILIVAYQSFEKAGIGAQNSEIPKVLAEANRPGVVKQASFKVEYV